MSPPAESFLRITPADAVEPSDLIGRCFETGVSALLVEEGALPASFFDLSSGVAGDLVQKVTNYQLRMAVVVGDLTPYSSSFRDFAREAAQGARFRFFPSSEEALAWLGAER